MEDLIKSLEQAEQGSEALDKSIARHLGFRIAATTGGPHIMRQNDDVASWDLPRYSRSLDAAVTLIPKGWRWEAADYGGNQDGPRAALWHGIPAEHIDDVQHHGAFGETPALALCIAALRARQAMEDS